MSNEPNVMSMPVHEVIAYLTEVAAFNQMVADRMTATIETLGEGIVAATEAQKLADSSADLS